MHIPNWKQEFLFSYTFTNLYIDSRLNYIVEYYNPIQQVITPCSKFFSPSSLLNQRLLSQFENNNKKKKSKAITESKFKIHILKLIFSSHHLC